MPSSLALLPCKSTGWFFKTIFWLHVLQTSLFKPETGFVGVSPHAAMSAMLTSKKTSGLIPFVFQQPMKIVSWVGTNQSSRSLPLTKRIETLGTRMSCQPKQRHFPNSHWQQVPSVDCFRFSALAVFWHKTSQSRLFKRTKNTGVVVGNIKKIDSFCQPPCSRGLGGKTYVSECWAMSNNKNTVVEGQSKTLY